MIDRETVELYTRLAALEGMLQFTLAMVYRDGKYNPVGVQNLHSAVVQIISQKAIPSVDAATSDLLSSELDAATSKLLDGAALLFGKLRDMP